MQRRPVWDYLTTSKSGRPSDLAASRELRRVPCSQSKARAIAAAKTEGKRVIRGVCQCVVRGLMWSPRTAVLQNNLTRRPLEVPRDHLAIRYDLDVL